MSNETPSVDAGTDSDTSSSRNTHLESGRELFTDEIDRRETGSVRAVTGAGLTALLAVVVGITVDILANLPFGSIAIPSTVRAFVAVGVPVVLALCLVAVAVDARRTTLRVGLLFVGIFGLFPHVSRAATIPALLAVTLGGGVALLGTEGRPADYRALRRRLVAAGVLAGVAVSLSSSIGLLDGSARGIGGLLALGAVTAMVVRAEGDRLGLAAGLLAFVLVVTASVIRPYVLGSALLTAFAVAGVPHILVACAVGGATAATVASLRRGEYPLAIGAPLVLLAGIPATFPRALAVVLGAALVLLRFGSGGEANRTPTVGAGT